MSAEAVAYGWRIALIGAAVWLFWPFIKDRVPFLGPKYVPIDEAALRLYEADEEKGAEWSTVAAGATSATARLNHFKYVLLSLDTVLLFGKKSPSRNMRAIPNEERKRLRPADSANSLSATGSDKPRYTDVGIRSRDLRKATKTYLAAANAMTRLERKPPHFDAPQPLSAVVETPRAPAAPDAISADGGSVMMVGGSITGGPGGIGGDGGAVTLKGGDGGGTPARSVIYDITRG